MTIKKPGRLYFHVLLPVTGRSPRFRGRTTTIGALNPGVQQAGTGPGCIPCAADIIPDSSRPRKILCIRCRDEPGQRIKPGTFFVQRKKQRAGRSQLSVPYLVYPCSCRFGRSCRRGLPFHPCVPVAAGTEEPGGRAKYPERRYPVFIPVTGYQNVSNETEMI
jgi:hypothetical protein